MTAGNNGGVWGKYSRYCTNNTSYKLIELSCANAFNTGSCTPPTCPIGWIDLNVISGYASAASSGGDFYRYYRYCLK